MKKLITLILALSLIIISATVFFGCDEGFEPNTSTQSSNEQKPQGSLPSGESVDTDDTNGSADGTGGSTSDTDEGVTTDSSSGEGDNTDEGVTTDSSGSEGDNVDEHKHVYETTWTQDEKGHYYACTCHPEEITVIEHTDLIDKDGLCDECEYVIKEQTIFTVSIKNDSGAPVSDVTVKFINGNEEISEVTDNEGKALCTLVYFDTVKVSIPGLPDGYRCPDGLDYTFDGNSLDITIEEVVTFSVYVLDENENPIPGVGVVFDTPFIAIPTDENGLASITMTKKELGDEQQEFFIFELPANYALIDTAFNSLVPIDNNATYTAHAWLTETYTVSAKDELGAPLKNAVFTFNGGIVEDYKAITDESGVVVAVFPKGEYNVSISHLSAFFVPQVTNTTLTEENNTFEAVFNENKDTELVWITPYYDDGSLLVSGEAQIYAFYQHDAMTCSLLGVNDNGQAATFMYNEDCLFFVIDKDMNYGIAEYRKNDPTDIIITVKKGVPVGKSEENPLPLLTIVDLPYNPEDMLFNDEQAFAKGEYAYLSVPNALGKAVTINGNLFTLEYNGQEIAPNEEGTICLIFTDVEFGSDAIIKITAREDATEDIALVHSGARDNPILVYSNKPEDLVQSSTLFGSGHTIYYSFANMTDKRLKLDVLSEGAGVMVEFPDGETVDAYQWSLIKITALESGAVTINFTYEVEETLKT